jgi:co-chaperonin GroES (HSP10)
MTDRRVLVELESQTEHQMPSGIIAVESHDPGTIGTVVAVGPEVTDVKRDDVVLFPREAGQVFELDGVEYLTLDEDEIIATWDSEKEPI